MDALVNGWIDRWVEGFMNVGMDEWVGGRGMDGWVDGRWMHGWMDRLIGG